MSYLVHKCVDCGHNVAYHCAFTWPTFCNCCATQSPKGKKIGPPELQETYVTLTGEVEDRFWGPGEDRPGNDRPCSCGDCRAAARELFAESGA